MSIATRQNERILTMKNRNYYESVYQKRMDEIYKEMKEENVEDIDCACTIEFDQTANAEEVVGYYLVNEGDNALVRWRENTENIEMTEQDKAVTEILERLFR